MLEELLKEYPNVLILRVRMPIVADLTYARNFITKIIKYDKVINIPNSMTVIPELLPYSIEMALRGLTGIMNYTNPGAISHNEILELYKQYIDPEFTWSNFTVEEQAKVIVAPRSNNLLDTERVCAWQGCAFSTSRLPHTQSPLLFTDRERVSPNPANQGIADQVCL